VGAGTLFAIERTLADDLTASLDSRMTKQGQEVAGWLAPMPGGVGPMTRAMLLANVVEAAERANP